MTSDLLGTVLGSSDQNAKETMVFVHISTFQVGLPWLMVRILINDLSSLPWTYGSGVIEIKICFLPHNFPHCLNFLQ